MLTQKLRHRIDIEDYVDVLDSNGETERGDQGEFIKEWRPVLIDEPAEVVPKSAREFYQSAAKQSETSGRMTIRRPALSITSAMRAVWQGQAYQIDGVMPDPSDRRWLTLLYSVGVNDGE